MADIHQSAADLTSTPRRYLAFINLYIDLYESKRNGIVERTKGLKVSLIGVNTLDPGSWDHENKTKLTPCRLEYKS